MTNPSLSNISVRAAAINFKPPYAIPSMEEIRAIPYNGLTVASLFSGGGGSSLGYRMAGFRVVYANDFVSAARDTYRANFPETPIDPRDVRDVTADDIRERAGVEIDLLDGSPPCTAFSTAGPGSGSWGKVTNHIDHVQRADDLFFEYARILKDLQPRVFVAENVAGLVTGDAKGYFIEILASLRAAGYRVRCERLDAQWLGVPQHRERMIFVGVREDLNRAPVLPAPQRIRYNVSDVLPEIARIKLGGEKNNWQSTVRPFPTLTAIAGATTINARFCVAFVELRDGSRRRLTIDEVKVLCSFPADFVLTGSFKEQWARCGNCVPPLMMRAIAEAIRDRIFLEDVTV